MAQRGKQQGNIPPGIRMPTQWEGNGIHGDLLRQLYEKGSFREGMTSDQYKQSVMLSDVRFMYRNRRGQTPTPSAQLQNANRWLRNYLADRGATGARLEGGAGAGTPDRKPSGMPGGTPGLGPKPPPVPQRGPKVAVDKAKGMVRVMGDCSWPVLWSRWVDSTGHKFIHLFVVLPSGTRGVDVEPVVSPSKDQVLIKYAWPAMMYQASRLYVHLDGRTMPQGADSHPKAAGLQENLKKLKKKPDDVLSSDLVISLPCKVEGNFVDVAGFPSAPKFHMIKSTKGPYNTLVMTLGLMEHRAARKVRQTADDRDYE